MKLTVTKRTGNSKGENNRLRREGHIPAVMYADGKPGQNLTVNGPEFHAALRAIMKGHLPTTVFTVVNEDGQEVKALVKDIQYHRTTYAIQHLDLEELREDALVNVNVPIDCVGEADCVGVKLGGVVRRVIRRLRVRCLPKDLPAYFELDVRELAMKGTKRLRDIALPEGVTPLQDLNEVAVLIAKR